MKLHEASYYRHPVLTWITDQLSNSDFDSGAVINPSNSKLILTPDEYDTLRKVLPREFGEPTERQDGMHWVLKKNNKRFYLDLQKLFGLPEDKSRRLTISPID